MWRPLPPRRRRRWRRRRRRAVVDPDGRWRVRGWMGRWRPRRQRRPRRTGWPEAPNREAAAGTHGIVACVLGAPLQAWRVTKILWASFAVLVAARVLRAPLRAGRPDRLARPRTVGALNLSTADRLVHLVLAYADHVASRHAFPARRATRSSASPTLKVRWFDPQSGAAHDYQWHSWTEALRTAVMIVRWLYVMITRQTRSVGLPPGLETGYFTSHPGGVCLGGAQRIILPFHHTRTTKSAGGDLQHAERPTTTPQARLR